MVWRAFIFFLSQVENQLNKNSTFESLFAPDHSLGLSIRGLAVAWLHARLDSRLQYYTFDLCQNSAEALSKGMTPSSRNKVRRRRPCPR
jgi:hypothetical protein